MRLTLYIALFVLSLPIIAQTIVGNPTGTQTVAQPIGSSLDVNVLNNVEDASQFSGVDIGAQINAAFAACPTTQSCKVTLPPGHNYSYSTMFTIPGTLPFAALDCQGSALTYGGSGDASHVASENVNDASGYIANCYFYNKGGNTLSVNAIHQFSRNAFSYRDVSIDNFNNATSSGIFLDNTLFATGGAGYNERTRLQNVTFSYNTNGLRLLGNDGGTNSFARLIMIGAFCNASDGQRCVSVEGNGGFQSADVYDGFFDIRGNISGSATGASAGRAISVTGGADIRTGVFNVGFEGPNNAYLTYIDGTGIPGIGGIGAISGGGLSNFNSGTSDQYNVPQLINGGFTLQSPPFANGVQQALNSKELAGGNTWRLGIPDDIYNYGYFQLFKRRTTDPSDPEVDAEPTTGNMQTNMMYCNINGCGFGPGYGPSATRGGTTVPRAALESTAMQVRNPSVGIIVDGGAQIERTVDASGNIVDQIVSDIAGGAPSHHYIMNMRETNSVYDQVPVLDCFVYNVGYCTVTDLILPPHTPSTSNEACVLGQIHQDANFIYVCTSTNTWKRAALSSF